jgi:hypothetical protein
MNQQLEENKMGYMKEEYAIIQHYAELVKLDVDFVIDMIEKIQYFMDMGMWYSDSCEIVGVVMDVGEKFKDSNVDQQSVHDFYDFVADSVFSEAELLFESPIF